MEQLLSKESEISVILKALRDDHIKGDLAPKLKELINNPFIEYRVAINASVTGGSHASPCSEVKENDFKGCKTKRTEIEDFRFGEEQRKEYGLVKVDIIQKEIPSVSTGDIWCCAFCKYPIDIKFMNENKIEAYVRNRKKEKMISDLLAHKECVPIYKLLLPNIYEEAIKRDESLKQSYMIFKTTHPNLKDILEPKPISA